MFGKIWFGAVAFVVATMSPAGSQVFDYSQYPDLTGRWERFVVPGGLREDHCSQTQPTRLIC